MYISLISYYQVNFSIDLYPKEGKYSASILCMQLILYLLKIKAGRHYINRVGFKRVNWLPFSILLSTFTGDVISIHPAIIKYLC